MGRKKLYPDGYDRRKAYESKNKENRRVKDRIRKAKGRQNMTTQQLADHRLKNRVCVARHRHRDEKSDSPYKCKQTLGRAVKRKAVIQHLANQAGLTSDRSDRARSRNSSRLSDETVTKVKNFYNSDVASWQSPRKKM